MGAVLSTPPPSVNEEEVLLVPEVKREEEISRVEREEEIPRVEEKIPVEPIAVLIEHVCQYRPPYSQRKCNSKLTPEWIEKSRKMLEEDQSPYVDVCVRHLRFYVRTKKVRLQDREERFKYLQAARVKERMNLQKQDERVCQRRHGMTAAEYRFLSSFLQRCLEGKGLLLPDGRTVRVPVEVIENEEDPEIVENEGVEEGQ